MNETNEYTLFAIYKDGSPLERGAGISRNAFDKKASAKVIVTAMVERDYRETARDMFGIDYHYKIPEADSLAIKAQIRSRYEIKEFIPVG